MSLERVLRQRTKQPLRYFMVRLGRIARWLHKQGRDPRGAQRHAMANPGSVDRDRWRRWFKANKLYAARRRALRRAGCNIKNLPSNLPMYVVR